MSNNTIYEGMTVVCLDNENVENIVKQHESYVVTEVSHRGALLKLKNIEPSLASVRFIPLNSFPNNPVELVDASNY